MAEMKVEPRYKLAKAHCQLQPRRAEGMFMWKKAIGTPVNVDTTPCLLPHGLLREG